MESTSVTRSGEGAGPDALPGDETCDATGVPAELEEDGEVDAGDNEAAGDCAASPDSAGAGEGANIVPVAATTTIF